MNYTITTTSDYGKCSLENEKLVCIADTDTEEAYFSAEVEFSDWEEDAFVFMPACAYNGNRIKRVNRRYPPKYTPEEYGTNSEELINNIPSLNIDGSGEIDVTTGDMALPCIGIYYRKQKKAMFLFTEQMIKDKNIGYCVQAGKITVSLPANRKNAYRFDKEWLKNPDKGISVKKGERFDIQFTVKEFECADFADFYNEYFNVRKSFLKCDPLPDMYSPKLWDLVMTNKNDVWAKRDENSNKNWGCGGWCGGYMETVARVMCGDELSRKNAIEATDFNTLPEHISPSGFFYMRVTDGVPSEEIHYVRRSADTLYFLFKMFDVTEPKPQWIKAARTVTDALYNLFERYGKFGQAVDQKTGELLIGCSESGTAAISALAKASKFFGEPKYLEAAKKACDYYFAEFMKKGYSCGGPEEALCAPDSESAFTLLEGCVVLYDITKEEKWLEYAKVYTHYCSSWVVSYTYKFPEGSEFDKKKINTVGSVYANAQNKHSAPGICTSSGDYIYRLYKYTNNQKYLEFIRDIAYFIPQCMATEERPLIGTIPQPYDPEGLFTTGPLVAGGINERVNMSDWEEFSGVGNIFSTPCWSTEAFVLTYGELIENEEFIKAVKEVL